MKSKLIYVNQDDERLEDMPSIEQDPNKQRNSSGIVSLYDDDNDEHQVSVIDGYQGDPNSFKVFDPQKGSHIVYTDKGYDNESSFEGTRWYNDFYNLRSLLMARMPGIYVPPIPPKKALGNKNDKFFEERGYFLQRFLQLVCRIPSIIKSD